ncbi:MAG TPA: hypothetical protein PJ997_02825 [Candidatus Paceibacterota bacterium]|nr:hypothetical protein [Candidatus Paceibacterota bacterium]HMP19244.1 hypothetical protein [Candidatus Paceibacterota bacterium]
MTDLSRVKNGESTQNEHHRKPRSRGGKSGKKNKVKVPIEEHIAFHYFYGDRRGGTLPPDAVIRRFKDLFPRIEALFMHKDGSRKLKTADEALHDLNNIWNDPDVLGVIDQSIPLPKLCD